jgi:DEAD/DEAH box helicase domain-containing protein
MGSLSFGQLMREAYPGAIYYYATIPYRVTRVNVKAKHVQVRREKRYTTQPQRTPPAVFPRLTAGSITGGLRIGNLACFECNLLVRESIRGVVEQRGRNESIFPYPLPRELGFVQEQPYFSRNFFTTGVVISHPAVLNPGIFPETLANFLYEAFMLMIPYDRQDIGHAADRFRTSRLPVIAEGQGFLAIYDQTYGSLRLSNRLLDVQTLGMALMEAFLLAGRTTNGGSAAVIGALGEMARAVFSEPRQALAIGDESGKSQDRDPEVWERIVMPGSKGLMVRTSEEFQVSRVLNTPAGLSYEGTPLSMAGANISVMPLLSDVAEIPGESQVGWYNIENEIIELAQAEENLSLRPVGPQLAAPEIDPVWLARVLSTYIDRSFAQRVAQETGAPFHNQDDLSRWLEKLCASVHERKQMEKLLNVIITLFIEHNANRDTPSQ